MPVSGSDREKAPRNNLAKNQRHRLIEDFLAGSTKGKLGHGVIIAAAKAFACSTKQVSRVWQAYQLHKAAGIVDIDLRS